MTYVGDGNNVCHSLMVACAKLGANVTVATPRGYEPSVEVTGWAELAAAASGGSVRVIHDPKGSGTQRRRPLYGRVDEHG